MTTIPKLTPLRVELTPRSVSGRSLATMLTKEEWHAIRLDVLQKNDGKCVHCSATADRANVLWKYNSTTNVQTLMGVDAVCPDCGLASHYQAVRTANVDEKIQQHLMHVNGWNEIEMEAHVEHAVDLYMLRSNIDWTSDASWLWSHYAISEASKARLLRGIRTADQKREEKRLNKKAPR